MKRLAIVITHPIQYYAPIFKILTERRNIKVKVFYSWHAQNKQFDRDFSKEVQWDIPLLDGYDFFANKLEKNVKRSFFNIPYLPLKNAIVNWMPDAVLIFGWNYLAHLKLMVYFKGKIPIYFRGDSNMLIKSSWFHKQIRFFFLKLIYKFVDKAFYVGTHNKKYFMKHGISSQNLIFAPHAIDNKRFSFFDKSEELNFLKKQFGISDELNVVVFSGKFTRIKNPLFLLDAFIDANCKNMQLVMVGDGVLKEKLHEKAQGRSDIIFLPFQNQSLMPLVYRLGDVVILTSKSETWGLAVNEAFASFRPAIINDLVGCGVDLVKGQQTGWIYTSDKKEELVSIFKYINNCDKKELRTLGENSHKLIQSWSFEEIVNAIENVMLNEKI